MTNGVFVNGEVYHIGGGNTSEVVIETFSGGSYFFIWVDNFSEQLG